MSTGAGTISMKRYYIFFVVLALVTAAAIGGNIMLRRGPAHDTDAVADLNILQSGAETDYSNQNMLPSSLSQINTGSEKLKRSLSEYSYARLDDTHYQLCATFMTVHHVDKNSTGPTVPELRTSPDPSEHGLGRQCFTYTVITATSDLTPLNR
ncbi:MAG: hypothetical protein JWN01_433 [Patescibacteria group bacterium]|nr:hypothetical protein [Patescibacteria group bacterium]